MANVTITSLPALTIMTDTDVIPVVNVGANQTQQITGADLKTYFGSGSSGNAISNGTSNVAIPTANGNVVVNADTANWVFDDTGNLTIPGNTGGLIKTVANASIGITAINNGTDNPAQLMSWTVGAANPSTIVSTYANSATVMTDVNGTMKTWTFDNAGTLTVAGNIVMPPGASLTGTGASPAPSISGFNSVNAATVSASGNITGGNANITATTASTSRTTGALRVAGGVGVAGAVNVGTSVTIDGGAYGNVVTTQFASVFASGSGPNPQSIMQVRGADGIAGMGIRAYSGLGGEIYANASINFTTGSTVRDKDFPTGGTTRATLDSTGLTVTGIANISGNITGGNLSVGGTANISNVTINSYTAVPQTWFKGTLSIDQSLTTGNDTVILYNTNTDPLTWGTTAGSNGHVVPNKSGWYEVVSRAQFSAIAGNVNAQINHQILVNDVQQAIAQVPNNSVVGAGVAVVATAVVQLNGTTDYITTSCYTTITGQTCVGSTSTMLSVKWISN